MIKLNFKLVAVGVKTWLKQSIMRIRIDKNGGSDFVDLPRSLQFRPAALRDRLADAGAEFSTEPRTAVAEVNKKIISKLNAIELINFSASIGWYDKRTFVLPSKTISLNASNVSFGGAQPGVEHAVGSGGNSELWSKNIGALVKKSDYALFATALALAGPALELLGETESPIFNFWSDDSSTGKTTLLLLLTSVYGKASRNLLANFELTARAREEVAAACNCLSKAIDEMALGGESLLTAKGKADFAMMLAGGGGRRRSEAVKGSLPNLIWRGAFITSGNQPAVKGSHKRENSGPTAVRWMDIMVPPKKVGGILNRGPNEILGKAEVKRNAQFLHNIEQVISENYGHLGEKWITHLVHRRNNATKRLAELTKKFCDDEVHSTEASELRIGKKWAGVAAIAQYAAEKKLVPWTAEKGHASVTRLYRNYLRDMGKSSDRHERALEALLQLIKSGEGFPSYSLQALKRKQHTDPGFFYGFKLQRSDGTWLLCLQHDQMGQLSEKLGLKHDELKVLLEDNQLVLRDAQKKVTRVQRLPWKKNAPRVRMVLIEMRALRAFLKH